MNLVTLMRGTLRELAAKATLYVLAGISLLILLVAALAIGSQSSPEGTAITMFGHPASPPVSGDELADFAGKFEAGFAGGLFLGIVIFGVFGTAGVLPDALEKGTVDLYLSKPIARWELIAGKSLGSIAAIFLNVVFFIGGLWLIVGLRVGVWNTAFLLSALLITYAFAVLYAVVAFFGVLSRNMAIAIIAGLLYLLFLANPLESRQTGLYLLWDNGVYRTILDGLYYLLPQVPAMQGATMHVIAGESAKGAPYLQSFLSGGLIFGASAWLLRRRDF